MELKANELRIGNWILNEDKEENQIEHLQPIYSYAYRWEWLKYYKPIPLTEDWLIKFGFTKYEWCDETAFIKLNRKHLYLRKLNNEWISEIRTVKKDSKGHFLTGNYFTLLPKGDLNYVHQIQNLYFSLTQKELILKD